MFRTVYRVCHSLLTLDAVGPRGYVYIHIQDVHILVGFRAGP
jgi:hypothetical protein